VSKRLTIGISFSEAKYPNYPAWIKGDNMDIEIIELSWEKQNQADIEKCRGLLLTGGIDIDPYFYPPQSAVYPHSPKQFNRIRDQFEIQLFSLAQERKMPVLGICRGLQLVNVALGGSLHADVETAGKQNHRNMDGIDHMHTIQIKQNTLLQTIVKKKEGGVNSAHHQSINRLADSLEINCFSEDDIVEGIEWKNKTNVSPLLCVQWHPERLVNKSSAPFSNHIRDWFLTEAIKFEI
jgi:putative glutamine amidotransferase